MTVIFDRKTLSHLSLNTRRHLSILYVIDTSTFYTVFNTRHRHYITAYETNTSLNTGFFYLFRQWVNIKQSINVNAKFLCHSSKWLGKPFSVNHCLSHHLSTLIFLLTCCVHYEIKVLASPFDKDFHPHNIDVTQYTIV